MSNFLCSRKPLFLPSDVESSRAWWMDAGNKKQVKRVTFALFLFSLITSYKLCYLVGSVQTKRFYQINAFQFRHCSKWQRYCDWKRRYDKFNVEATWQDEILLRKLKQVNTIHVQVICIDPGSQECFEAVEKRLPLSYRKFFSLFGGMRGENDKFTYTPKVYHLSTPSYECT